MSIDIGFNSDINVSRRKFHLQTSYLEETNRVQVAWFEGGRMVQKREFAVQSWDNHAELQKQISDYHESVKSDIELLFMIIDKVRSSKHPASITRLAVLFHERGFYNEAIDLLLFAQKSAPEQFDSHVELGRAYLAKQDYEPAIYAFDQAIKLHPDFADIHYFRAQALWHAGHFGNAMQAFYQALDLNKSYSEVYYTQGLLLVQSTINHPIHPELDPPIERLKYADYLLRQAPKLSKNYDDGLINKALDLLNQPGKADEAMLLLRKAKRPETADKAAVFDSEFYIKFMFGELDEDQANLDFYIKRIEAILERHPNYADLRQSLGIAYLIKGWQCFKRSTEEFRKAVDINASYEKAYKNLKLMQNDGRGLLILLRAILS